MGTQEINGEKTDQLAIIIYVKEKLPESQLSPDVILPKGIEGHVTDVKELIISWPPGCWVCDEEDKTESD